MSCAAVPCSSTTIFDPNANGLVRSGPLPVRHPLNRRRVLRLGMSVGGSGKLSWSSTSADFAISGFPAPTPWPKAASPSGDSMGLVVGAARLPAPRSNIG